MASVLIAWELGEAYGHLATCLRLAEGLRRRGHTVVLALKDVRLPAMQVAAPGITVVPAPLTPQDPADRVAPVNYAGVLLYSGFAQAHDVAARLAAWQGLIELARAEVLVADHAPTALLAAHLAGIAHLAIGNGFAVPPASSPWPSIRPWEDVSEAALVAAETRLDAVTGAALRMFGRSVAVRMRDLYGAQDVLATFAELDHHGERPDARYVGVIASAPGAIPVAWQHREGVKLLAYLRPAVPGFAAILQGLARLDAEVLCVAPGLAPAAARRLATRRLRIALAPVALPPLLAEADLAIGYGNSGFSTQALLAGVPLLMRPRHVEQAIFARRVEAAGAGRLLGGPLDADGVAAAVRALLDQPACREAARAFRDRYRHATPERAVEQALDCIERAVPTRRGMRAAKSALPSQEPVEAWRT